MNVKYVLIKTTRNKIVSNLKKSNRKFEYNYFLIVNCGLLLYIGIYKKPTESLVRGVYFVDLITVTVTA